MKRFPDPFVLMIHEMKEEFFELPLEDFTLTFDDGLYSQYYYFDKLKEINTEKIFFISTDIVASEDVKQSTDFPSCINAHNKFLNTRCAEDYMKWSQINDIANTDGCYVGGHSHLHNRLPTTSIISTLIRDTREMRNTFKAQLGYCPDKFCFPYNEHSGAYKEILTHYGFNEFYSDDRIDVYEF